MMKTTKLTKLLSALLLLCSLFAFLTGTAAAEEFKGQIATIGIVAADTEEAAKQQLTATGHTVIDVDLNEGTTRGKRVYMGYTTTMDPSKAITGLMLYFDDKGNPPATFDGYTLVGSAAEPNTANTGIVDLNAGAGGSYIYLYVKRDAAKSPITDIMISPALTAPEDYIEPWVEHEDNLPMASLHLNLDAEGGSRLYMYYTIFSYSYTVARLQAYYLSETGTITNFYDSKYLKHTQDAVTFSGQPMTVTYDGVSYAFAGWKENWTTGAPTYTNTGLSVGMSSFGGDNNKLYFAVYDRTTKLSFNANGGTGAPAQLTATQYLNMDQVNVKVNGVTFTIPNQTPVNADPTKKFYCWAEKADGSGRTYAPGDAITLTKDVTLYAVWTVNVTDGTVELSQDFYFAYGKKREPGVTVKVGGVVLPNSKYTVKYSDNYASGTAKVTVTLKDEYEGTLTAYFHIAEFSCRANPNGIVPPRDGESATITLHGYQDGEEITSDPRLSWRLVTNAPGVSIAGNKLIITSDFEGTRITCAAWYSDGSYVERIGTVDVSVSSRSIGTPYLDFEEVTFDGMPHKPQIVQCMDAGIPLTEGEHYTVAYLRNNEITDDFTSAGTITVQLTGINGYTGVRTASVNIRRGQMADVVAEDFQNTFYYTGYPQKPEVVLRLPNGYLLREGRDYTLTYMRSSAETTDFTSVGSITIKASAVAGGNCTGSRSVYYSIKENNIQNTISITVPDSPVYNGQPHEPVIEVTHLDKTLTEGVDYTVTYTRNGEVTTDLTSAGTIKVEVTGTGIYTGSANKKYTIGARQLTESMVTVTPAETVWNGSEQKPVVTVDGVLASDYIVTYKRGDEVTDDFTTCGTITVTIEGTGGNCSGKIVRECLIDHHPDLICGHAGMYAIRYQATGSDVVKYSNDIVAVCGYGSPLKETGGTVTLLKPIVLDSGMSVQVTGLTIELNGNSITFTTNNDRFSVYKDDVTIVGPGTITSQKATTLYSNKADFALVGDVTLVVADADYAYMHHIWSNGDVDMTQYTGGEMLVRCMENDITVQVNEQKYELLAYTPQTYTSGSYTSPYYDRPGTIGEPVADGVLTVGAWAKVARKHDHSWSFSLNASGDAIEAVCSNAATCPAEGGRVTIRLNAPADLTYNGQAKKAAVEQTPAGIIKDMPTEITGEWINAGTYTAKLTYGGVTAEKTFTIQPMDITGAAVGAFAEMTYNGTAQTPVAVVTIDGMEVTGTWSSVTNVSDTTNFTATGNFTGTIADQATGMKKAVPTAADFRITLPENPVYDGQTKVAVLFKKDGIVGMGVYQVFFYMAGDDEYESVSPVDAGEYCIAVRVSEGENYTAHRNFEQPLTVGSFTITQAQTALTAQTDAAVYTYGETIIVRGTVNVQQPEQRSARMQPGYTEPTAQQVALYDANGMPLTSGENVQNGSYTITYDTTLQGIVPGENITLTVRFVGDANMADQVAMTNYFRLDAMPVSAVLSGAVTKTYDGTTDVPAGHSLTLSLDSQQLSDIVTVSGSFAYADAAVGSGKEVKATGITLGGPDAQFYRLNADYASNTVGEITKAKLSGVTAPVNQTLDAHCADAEAAAAKLPATIPFTDENGGTVDVAVSWTCESYNDKPGAENTFTWTVDDADKMACYDIESGVAASGSITVTNAEALPVEVTGTNKTVVYSGSGVDVSTMFTIDPNAGTADYQIISGGTGEGTLSGSVLTVTKAGTFAVKLNTAAGGAYAAGEAAATLTVEKGTPVTQADVPTGLTAWYSQKLSDIELNTTAHALGAWVWVNPDAPVGDAQADAYSYAVKFIPNEAAAPLWNEVEGLTASVTVAKADAAMTAAAVDAPYIYGTDLTIRVTVNAQAPARSAALFAGRAPAGSVKLLRGGEVLAEKAAENGATVEFTLNTLEDGFLPGSHTLTAQYTGSNMNTSEATVTFAVSYLPDGESVPDAEIPDDEWFVDDPTLTAPDDCTISLDPAVWPEDGETGNSVTAPTVDGENKIPYYIKLPDGTIAKKEITADVDKTAPTVSQPQIGTTDTTAEISVEATDETSGIAGYELTMTGGDGTPAITNHGDGTFDLTGLMPGAEYSFELTVTDGAGNTTTVQVSLIASAAPRIISPTDPSEVLAYVGETAEFEVVAENAYGYEWYRSVDGGRTFIPAGKTAPSYETTPVTVENEGYQYFCRVYGQSRVTYVDSPVVTLRVVKPLPETGDNAQVGLWLAMCIISCTGMLAMAMHGKKRNVK